MLRNIFDGLRIIALAISVDFGFAVGALLPAMINKGAVSALGGLVGAGIAFTICISYYTIYEPDYTKGKFKRTLNAAKEKGILTEDLEKDLKNAYDYYDKQGIKSRKKFVKNVEKSIYANGGQNINNFIR